jgi:hypothetical protein
MFRSTRPRNREVPAIVDAVAAGPHACQRCTPPFVDLDAASAHVENVGLCGIQRIGHQLLADGLEDHVRRQYLRLAGTGQRAVRKHGPFDLDAGRLAIGQRQAHRLRPVPDAYTARLCELALPW